MENVFNFLAQMLEKANQKGAFTLQESTGVFQALSQLQGHLFPGQEEQPAGPKLVEDKPEESKAAAPKKTSKAKK